MHFKLKIQAFYFNIQNDKKIFKNQKNVIKADEMFKITEKYSKNHN